MPPLVAPPVLRGPAVDPPPAGLRFRTVLPFDFEGAARGDRDPAPTVVLEAGVGCSNIL